MTMPNSTFWILSTTSSSFPTSLLPTAAPRPPVLLLLLRLLPLEASVKRLLFSHLAVMLLVWTQLSVLLFAMVSPRVAISLLFMKVTKVCLGAGLLCWFFPEQSREISTLTHLNRARFSCVSLGFWQSNKCRSYWRWWAFTKDGMEGCSRMVGRRKSLNPSNQCSHV